MREGGVEVIIVENFVFVLSVFMVFNLLEFFFNIEGLRGMCSFVELRVFGFFWS